MYIFMSGVARVSETQKKTDCKCPEGGGGTGSSGVAQDDMGSISGIMLVYLAK